MAEISAEYEHAGQVAQARRDIADVCQLMHQRGMLAARDGNVSVRVGARRLLVTPSGARKGFMAPGQMVLTDLEGRPVRGETGVPSSEIAMHVVVYKNRPDVNAVVHAHPPYAVAHTVAGISLAEPLMPEVFCELGEVLTVPYTTPGTVEVPSALAEPIRNHQVLMLEAHGSLCVGPTLHKAYDRLEILEHAARISAIARSMQGANVKGLSPQQLASLSLVCTPPTT